MASKQGAKITLRRAELHRESGLRKAIEAWADATTDASSQRRFDLLRDKKRVVAEFFEYVRRRPQDITPADVKAWQVELQPHA